MEEPFFVCVYKKDGMPIGKIVSPENEFPESFEEIKVKSSDGDNIEEKASEFEKIFESYCNSILSYIDMLPFIASISPMVGDAIRSVGLINFLKEKSGKTIETEGRDIFEVPSRFYSDFKEIADSANKASAVGRQIPKMMIIGIVSTYEHHLARLIRKILSSNPDRLTSSDKQVSIKDVFDAKGIDEFKEIVLDKEIDMIMRNSFEEQVSWVEKAIGIRKEIKSEHGDWPKIVELFERRNLFTHTNGIVNDRYLKKSVKLKVSGSSALVKGQELFAGSKYLTSALEIICEFGIKIIQVSWRKLSKEHAKIADDRLGDFGFELIERGNYGLAIKIFEFFFYLEGSKTEERRLTCLVNLANAYKLNGDSKKAEKLLDQEDFSVVNDTFKICVASVGGDCDEVVKIMKRMGIDCDIGEKAYEDWPVFFHVREKEQFKDAFKDVFGREYIPSPKKRRGISNAMRKNEFRAQEKKSDEPLLLSPSAVERED